MAAHPSPPGDTDPGPTRHGSRSTVTLLCALGLLIVSLFLFGREGSSSDAPRPPDARPAPLATHPSATASPAAKASPAVPASPATTGSPAVPASPSVRPAGQPLPRSHPVRLRIPKISVDAPFTPLEIGRTGQLDAPPPDDVNLVGWYVGGATPGEAGTSIIAGHVDTTTSPAVFAGLSRLVKGDVFNVVRADGSKANFVVDDVERFDKNNFPDERVYADTARAEVRLITCAGNYDRLAKDYTENLVVFGHLL